MPRIPDDLIERLKHEVLLEELARRRGVELRRVGEELVGRCPFHEDATPSLSVNPARNLFQCFGCGAAGTSVDWTMREKDLDFRQAVELLLRDFLPTAASQVLGDATAPRRVSRRSNGPELPCPFDLSADEQTTLDEYADFCHALLLESAEARDYLARRGLDDPDLVSRFKLGYQDRTLGLRLPTPVAKAGREVRERFQRLGLIRPSGHAHFVGSLVVPTVDLLGHVTGLYGRKTRDDLNPAHASPRHLYLPGPDQDVFNEEAFVEGAPSLLGAGKKEIVLTEARIDALSFYRHGFRNVTACRGVHLSEALLSAFVRYGVERCLIAFDRDEPGDRGAEKVASKLMPAGIACFRVLFPKGMDANEVSLKMTPADKTLGLFLRSAEWMGNGHVNGRRVLFAAHAAPAPAAPATVARERAAPPSAAEDVAAKADAEAAPGFAEAAPAPAEATEDGPSEAAEEEIGSRPAPEPAAPRHLGRFAQAEAHLDPPSTHVEPVTNPAEASAEPGSAATSPATAPTAIPGLTKLGEDEAELLFEDRRYRLRGLSRCRSLGSLRVSLKVEREGDLFTPPCPIAGWHLDTLDLCVYRSRQLFERQAAHELGVREEVVRFDLGRILRALEEVQERRIAEALAPKTKAVTLTARETEEALALLADPDLLTRIVADLGRWGLVGEATNKLVTYLGVTSRLLERPLAVLIQSSSAAGKTSLMDAVLALVPEEQREKYTAVSGKSLFYFDEDVSLSHKVLAIVEEEGAEKATYPLKILQSEGELVMASTGKDPQGGRLVTKVYRVKGPVMILLTTTAVEVDPELENRCLRLSVDESREQTRRIHELQRRRQTLEGLLARKERERIERLHRNAQRLLRPVKVVNPFVDALTFVDDQTRTRRDHEKYLTLIETIAFLHQHQREIKHVEIGGEVERAGPREQKEVVECVEVTLADIEAANRIAAEVLGKTLDELPPQTRRFLSLLHEAVAAECEETGVTQGDLRFSRRQARRWTGWSATQVGIHVGRLVELEYLLVHRGGRGQSFVYELLWRGEGLDDRPFVLGLVDVERLRAGEEASTTTATYRGPEGGVTGVKRGQNGPETGGARSRETRPRAAVRAALHVVEAEQGENALLPPAPSARSYSRRRPPRLNLLRFPPTEGGAALRPSLRLRRVASV